MRKLNVRDIEKLENTSVAGLSLAAAEALLAGDVTLPPCDACNHSCTGESACCDMSLPAPVGEAADGLLALLRRAVSPGARAE